MDPRMAAAPIRRMQLQATTPYYDDYDFDPLDTSLAYMGGKTRAMTLPPHMHMSYDPVYPMHPHCACGSHHGIGCSGSSKSKDSSSNSSKGEKDEKLDFKTKDLFIRSKLYSVRASYLAEAPKFEAELTKLMDKKKEDIIPSRILTLLLNYINKEDYTNDNVLDEVTLHVVCTTVNCRSAAEFALERLKRYTKEGNEIGSKEMVQIVVMVLMSEKVDNGLKEWLKNHFKGAGNEKLGAMRQLALAGCKDWLKVVDQKPEVENRLMVLLDFRVKDDEAGYRIF
jgi:hypothetical protein